MVGAAATGAAGAIGAQVAVGAAVPTLMSFFGTVVSGVGTIHASASAWGAAAIFQQVAAASVASVSAVGGVAGVVGFKLYQKLK